ncbi:TetR/AcrR family transcriptional regulator [Aldersonia kunmingensis]|uniref:TetR/AcrR family transcriptional regulator n=1 Tax=Aldersonia kunmingensis TaxID=408066 RepID=UPI00082A608A|nr:TetR/AcrR family transcriptional regulator [Aldersonia kunmingensis]
MASSGPGRPRLEQRRRPGKTPRAEILDAAAELFTKDGYANTSTRRIADAVGIRQASLYHHFATKDDILDALLGGTVADALELSQRLIAIDAPAEARLYRLVQFDVSQLCAGRWNLGALYLLPELRTKRFAEFRRGRNQLRHDYATLAQAVVDGLAESAAPRDPAVVELPFRLVESSISIRSDEGRSPKWAAKVFPVAALQVLGWSGDVEAVATAAAELPEADNLSD